MEAELEILVKEKEQSMSMEVIPLSIVPLTRVRTTSVEKTSIEEILSTTPMTSLEKIVELAKSMEKMDLQVTDICRLKMEFEDL
jgi:hypothetical protein